ncbi:uncharacterized protein LOC111335609 [Stylophora pistillata]|nr:uncharacterized protein LOC111335609 [Stylophora pistillata]
MASATSPFASSEKENYYRLYRLLVEVGSEVLRATFDKVRPSGDLDKLLANPRITAKLRSLWEKEVLSSSQWDKLYPSVRSAVSSRDFDTALLGILLMSICYLHPPETGWNEFPCISDTTIHADIIRFRFYYVMIHNLSKEAAIDDTAFNFFWKNIQDILVRLGGAFYKKAIDDLKRELLDAACEEHYNILFKQEAARKDISPVESLLLSAMVTGVGLLTGRVPISGELVPLIMAHLFVAIAAYKSDEGERSQDVKAKKNEEYTIVPEEILARGPLTLYAYNKALMEGKTKVRRLPIMLIGQDRAGKTSLKRSLKGERFDANEKSTSGIEVDPFLFEVTTEVWRLQNLDQVSCCSPTTSFEHQAARLVANELIDTKETGNGTNGTLTDTTPNSQAKYDPPMTYDSLQLNHRISHTNDSAQAQKQALTEPGMPEELVDLIRSQLFEDVKSDDEEEIYSILWDFGGQLVYYVTHPLFLTKRAIYLLAYDLSRNPNDRASPSERRGLFGNVQDRFCLETNFDYLDSWMSSVASLVDHFNGHYSNMNQSDNLPKKLPPVFLVCTHADRAYSDQDPASLAANIFGSLQGKLYSSHLFKSVFAVDNTKAGTEHECPEVIRLRQAILSVVEELPHVREDIPLKWLKFEKELHRRINEDIKWISFEEARQIAFETCYISDELEFTTLLNFLHDQRIVIHFDDTPSLNKMVVLDVQWLIDVFKRVITVEPYGVEGSHFEDLWLELEKTGILHEELLEHVWGTLYQQRETFESLTQIMEKFSLMCKWPSTNDRKQYLVPSMLMSYPSEDVVSLVASSRLPSLYISFHSRQVPTSLFPRMVLQFYQWCSKKWPCPYKPQLYRNFARFLVLPQDGCSIILLCHSSFIEVVAHRASEVCDTSNSSRGNTDFSATVSDQTPDLNVARAVRRQLVLMLECMRKEFPWLKNMEWQLKVLCSVCCRGSCVDFCRDHVVKNCRQEHCLHFWSEADFARDQPFVICARSACATDPRIDIRMFAPWFTFLDDQKVQLDHEECLSRKLCTAEEREAKELFISSGALESLQSSDDASDVVVRILDKMQLSQEALTNPAPETTRIIRSLARMAKRENRSEVAKHLRKITSPGTAGPLLPEELDIQKFPIAR